MKERVLSIPLTEDEVRELKVGDIVYLKGNIFTSRDMGHLTIRNKLETNQPLPVEFKGAAIFHAGPVVRKRENGWELVVIGPTTSIRMEPYAEMVGKLGVKAIIGKGGMGEGSSQAYKKYGAVYLQAAPGCAVKLADGIESIENVYWLELGVPEALWVLKAKMFGPLVVAMDSHGASIYRDIREIAFKKVNELYG
ncbi:MAG: fumarate hydratase [Firmicutes bacterium]|jgi:tartrate/fumarate subfamily iron-sulfur-dependent hydro-lyase beta chain|nr:fumarate hydratase [Bacillota bacterium]